MGDADWELEPPGAPSLSVSEEVAFGDDIVVNWKADGLSTRVAHPLDWVGLYLEGDCLPDTTSSSSSAGAPPTPS